MTETGRSDPVPALSGTWDDTVVEQLVEINHDLLARVAQVAGSPSAARFPLIAAMRAEWLSLTAERLQRLARCPYLLVDLAALLPDRGSGGGPGVRDGAGYPEGNGLARILGHDLIRRAVMLGWHLGHANPLAARIALGLNGAGVAQLAAMRLADLDRLAESRASRVRPRWERRLDVWQQLLQATNSDQDARLRPLQLRGVQLIASGVLVQS